MKYMTVIPVVMLLITISVVSMLSTPELIAQRIYPARAEIGDSAGIELNKTSLRFGRVYPNGKSTKFITIGNPIDSDVTIVINSIGNISDYLIISHNNFVLKPKEITNITLIFAANNGIKGRYEGAVSVSMYS